jgi:hypothetical protein
MLRSSQQVLAKHKVVGSKPITRSIQKLDQFKQVGEPFQPAPDAEHPLARRLHLDRSRDEALALVQVEERDQVNAIVVLGTCDLDPLRYNSVSSQFRLVISTTCESLIAASLMPIATGYS